MSRHRKKFTALLIALSFGLVFVWSRQRDPMHQGKRLSVSLKDLEPVMEPAFAPNSAKERAQEALRKIGVHAVPPLVRMLNARDSRLRMKLIDLLARQRWIKFRFEHIPASTIRHRALLALEGLGPVAEPAVPALGKALRDGNETELAINALGTVGPGAALVMPVLIDQLKRTEDRLNWPAAHALGNIGPTAVPALLQIAANQKLDTGVRVRTLWALGIAGANAKDCVPALLELATAAQTDLRIVRAIIHALGRIGLDSEATLPDLLPISSRAFGYRISDRMINGGFEEFDHNRPGLVGPSVRSEVKARCRPVQWSCKVGRLTEG